MKKTTFVLAIVSAALLAACGGGGGGDSAAASQGGGGSTTPTETDTDYVSKYVGTWKTTCWTASIYQDTSVTPSQSAYLTRSLTFTKTSGSLLALSATDTVYAAADTTCSGPIQATVTRTGLNASTYSANASSKTVTSSYGVNTATYVGTVALGTVTGDKFDAVQAPIFSTNNANLSIGTISFKSSDFQGGSGKVAYYLNGNTLTAGRGATATTYPNALQTDPSGIFTKQ